MSNDEIYSVYFYTQSFGAATVYPIGFYRTLDEAKQRLAEAIPNYKKGYKNCVQGCGRIGWINKNMFGDFKTNLSASQPHSSVNLFD